MVGLLVLLGGVSLLTIRPLLGRNAEMLETQVLRVEAVRADLTPSYTVSRVYTGEVAAQRSSELGFEQGGTLIQIEVDRGDRVTAGQPLARLDTRTLQAQRDQLLAQRDQAMARLTELQNGPRPEDIAAAQATVRDLEAQLQLERLRQQRRQDLYLQGAISREDRDVVTFAANALEERLTAARSQLQELQTGTRSEQIAAQAAAVQQLNAQMTEVDLAIEKSIIFAPFAGVITARRLDEGTIVAAGQAVLRLVEQAQVEVEVGLPGEVVQNLTLGQVQTVRIAGVSYPAQIKAIVPEIDPVTRTQMVVLQLEAVGDRGIPPEQLAEITLEQTLSTAGFWLPVTALTQGERGLWAVYALKAHPEDPDLRQVERRTVEWIHSEGEQAFVRGLLESGDHVIRDGTQRLVPGQSVRLQPSS
jgi:multidrug resistance efflux pump